MGYSVDGAAGKLNVAPARVVEWEAGVSHPSLPQLRNLGRVYRRPIAVFFLPEPPVRGSQPIRDYRRHWGSESASISPQLHSEIETAHARRDLAVELLELEGESPASFRLRASHDEHPDEVARRFRRALGVTIEQQLAWTDRYAGFNAWRDAIEHIGALVLQMTEAASGEARGFSISTRPLPAVVANIHDMPRARSFTLIHELTHIALNESGVCDLHDTGRTEPFCNHVAGAVLVPAEVLLGQRLVETHDALTDWRDADVATLSNRFSVSREVILRRLLILGKTTDEFYRAKREQYLDEYEQDRERRRQEAAADGKPRAIPQDLLAVARSGQYVSHLILSSYSHGRITASDVADYFGVRIKHLGPIERRVFGTPGA
jgi:Zn-dependent peptidase ImmA (M78 family)/transcriptional regulator with XRE-family HTH domain